MRRILAAVLGLGWTVNGLTMGVAPGTWASLTPGVSAHGPIPDHFVQDVGAAFVIAGVSLLLRAFRESLWPAAAAGAAFLGLHALLHLWEILTGHSHAVAADLVLVVVPSVLSIVAAVPGAGLSTAAFARVGLRQFSKHYDYDTTYLTWLLERAPGAFYRFSLLTLPGLHCAVAPRNAYHAAKLVGALSEDCGPCTQLVTNMAREAGVPADQIAAVLARDIGAMGLDTSLGFRFADAVVHRRDEVDELRAAVVEAYGDAGLADLVLAFAIGRVYPMTKAGLGFAHECRLVRVDGEMVAVVHAS